MRIWMLPWAILLDESQPPVGISVLPCPVRGGTAVSEAPSVDPVSLALQLRSTRFSGGPVSFGNCNERPLTLPMHLSLVTIEGLRGYPVCGWFC